MFWSEACEAPARLYLPLPEFRMDSDTPAQDNLQLSPPIPNGGSSGKLYFVSRNASSFHSHSKQVEWDIPIYLH